MTEEQIRADERERVAKYLTELGMRGPASYVQGMPASPASPEPLKHISLGEGEGWFADRVLKAINSLVDRVNSQGEAIERLRKHE